MTNYPATLPLAQVSDYQVEIGYGLSSVAFERGNTRQRRSAKKEHHTFALSFALSMTELWTWQSWANQFGYDWHFMDLWTNYSGYTSATAVPHYIRYISDVRIEPLDGAHVRVSVQAELDMNTLPQGVVIHTGNWVLGGTPVSPSSTNLILGGTPASPSTDVIIAGVPGQLAA